MAGPISMKLSRIDEGYSAQHLEQNFFDLLTLTFRRFGTVLEQRSRAGGRGRGRRRGATQIKNELRSKENLS